MNRTEQQLRTILKDSLFVIPEADQITSDSSIRNDLGLDSIGFIELRQQVEETFAISIPDDDFTPENFATVATLTKLIDSRTTA